VITGSVVSYPTRSGHGRSSWPGNISGNFLRDLILTFRPNVVCDPACGSNTTGDVIAELNRQGHRIKYYGFDLHSGFDLITDSLPERLDTPADFVFFDPPWLNIHKYSGVVWGTQPHPSDISHCTGVEDYWRMMSRALLNIFEALKRGGRYSVKIGDVRRGGEYHPLQAQLIALAPGKLESVIIKQLHNCRSDKTPYANSLIFIEHEYVCTFRRDGSFFGAFDAVMATSQRLRMFSNCTWRAIVEYAFEHFGNRATLEQLYQFIEERAYTRIKSAHWKEKIRQTVQKCAVRVERGVYVRAAGVTQAAAAA
jgi:hypothetical protein